MYLFIVWILILYVSPGSSGRSRDGATTHRMLFISRHEISLVELIPPTDLVTRRHQSTTSAYNITENHRDPAIARPPSSRSSSSSSGSGSGDVPPPLLSRLLVTGLEDASAVDFLMADSSLWWSDATNGRLYQAVVNDTVEMVVNGGADAGARAFETGSGAIEVISTGLVSPDGLACDWVGRKVYWADADTDRMEVSELDGRSRKVIYWRDVDEPRSIAVDPIHGYMYWADWGETPKLERAGMDGDEETRSVIVSGDDISWSNSLTIDHDAGRIYWTDMKLRSIQSARLDGSDRRQLNVFSGSQLCSTSLHLTSMTLVDDLVYWIDWRTLSIYAAHKDGEVVDEGGDSTGACRVVATNVRAPMNIRAYGPRVQASIPSPCGTNNSGCSHLCLLSPSSPFYRCACPTGVRLLPDNRTCADGADELLMLARRSDLRCISLDTLDYTDVVLDISGVRSAVAIDVDPVDRMVYWTDDEVRAIRRAHLDGSGAELVIDAELEHPDGIAVDWISRNLYWTDKGTDRIEMSRLDGSSRRVIVSDGLREPRAIVVDPIGGRIYWTDWGRPAKIESAALDGTDRIVVVNTSLDWPNGLVIDRSQGRLYWADAFTDRIEMIFLNGSGRNVLISDNIPHAFGLALLGDYVYWTDWHRRTVERVHKLTGHNRLLIIEQLPDVMGLAAMSVSRERDHNGCSEHNGGCSHLCIHRPDGRQPRCLCPRDMELDSDEKRCVTPRPMLVYARQADIRRLELDDRVYGDDEVVISSGMKRSSAIGCHVAERRIYWTDTSTKTINSVNVDGGATRQVVDLGLSQPEGITIDWIANNLYWTDSATGRVEMSRLDGTSRLVLVWQDARPRAIAVDPIAGYVYWSNAISTGPRLERVTLDGMARRTLVSDVGVVNGLAIDHDEHRLYWSDVDRGCLEMSDMKGGSRRPLVCGSQRLSGIAVFGNHVYWFDDAARSISMVDKLTGAGHTTIRSRVEHVTGLSAYHVSSQLGWNACAVNNGGCSHLCIANVRNPDSTASVSYHCACVTHYTLAPDNHTCQAPNTFILIGQRSAVIRLPLNDVADQVGPDVTMPLRSLRNVHAVAYDVTTDFVYWIEARSTRSKSIRRARDDGSQVTVLVQGEINTDPYAIALYSVTGGKSELFWSDASRNNIRSLLLNGLSNRIVINETRQKPRFLAVVPNERLLFWTNINGKQSIECSSFDGSARRTLFDNGVKNLGPIAVDSVLQRIFWVDIDEQVIRSGSLDGGEASRLDIVPRVSNAAAIAIAGPFVYWADRESKSVQRANKVTGAVRSEVLSRLAHMTSLVAVVKVTVTPDSMACGGRVRCSHSCVVNADGKGGARCTCPADMILGADRKTCAEHVSATRRPPRCRDDELSCVVDGVPRCLSATRTRCSGIRECDDGSDESNCTSPATASCSPWQFRCRDDVTCVLINRRCDARRDCPDGSDEDGCAACDGGKDSVRCETDGWCIRRDRLCDGLPDCTDSQDERNCALVIGSTSHALMHSPNRQTLIIVGSSCVFSLIVLIVVIYFGWRYGGRLPCCRSTFDQKLTPSSSWLPTSPPPSSSLSKLRRKRASSTFMQSLMTSSWNGSSGGDTAGRTSEPCRSARSSFYNRVVATSPSTVTRSADTCYPRETLNPPPSPITTDCSASRRDRYSAWNSRAMSPCSTDVCGTEDVVYNESSWIGGTEFCVYETDLLYPPPPTPCSRYVSTDIDCQIADDDDESNATVSNITSGHCRHGQRRSHHHTKHSVTRAASLSSLVS